MKMKIFSHGLAIAVVWVFMLASPAYAGFSSFIFSNGPEFPGAQGELLEQPLVAGHGLQSLQYDFTSGGRYVAGNIELARPVYGRYIRLQVHAPADLVMALKVVDESNQTLQFILDRSRAPIDELGWATLTVPISWSPYFWGGANNSVLQGGVRSLALIVNRPAQAPYSGEVHFRDLEMTDDIYGFNPWAMSLPKTVSDIASFSFSNGPEFAGASGRLNLTAPRRGDSALALSYDFTRGGSYVAAHMPLRERTYGQYVHFQAHALASAPLYLRVSDEHGQTLQFAIDRHRGVTDESGWTTYSMPISYSSGHWGGANDGYLRGRVHQVSFVVGFVGGYEPTGITYLRRFTILDRAPTVAVPVLELNGTVMASYLFHNGADGGQPGAVGGVQVMADPQGEVTLVLGYDFGQGGQYVSAVMPLQEPIAGNIVRFLSQIPAGLHLYLRYTDETNQTFQTPVIKPFASLGESGWVQHAVRLNSGVAHWGGPNDGVVRGRITSLQFVIDSGAINSYAKVIRAAGSINLREIKISYEREALDLASTTVALPGLRPVGSDLTHTMGVVIHNNDPRAFQIARDMGFGRVRFDVLWGVVERERGHYDFSGYDNQVQAALAYGLSPILILAYNNPLYARGADSGISDPENRHAFLNFAAAAVDRYRGRGVVFEIWNEPNLHGNWREQANAAEFALLMNEAVARMRAVDNQVQIITGGLSQIDFSFIKALKESGILPHVQGVGVHPYAQQAVETMADESVAVGNEFSKNGINTPVWFTEIGASPVWYGGDSRNYDALYRQANMVARGILTQWAINSPSVVVYQLRDEVSHENPHDPEANFGLLAINYGEKPAKKVVDLLFDSARGRQYRGTVTGVPTSLQAMKFSAPGRESVYVAWMNTPGDGGRITVADTCNRYIDLAGRASGWQSSCVADLGGNPVPCTAVGNGRMSCQVSEGGGPVFVRVAE